MSTRRPDRSDVSDARWALIEPVFAAWRSGRTGPGVAARVHDLREIVNAILSVNRTGIPWEYLPHDFPPHKTVYDHSAKREAGGTTGRVHDPLRDKTRRAHGRAAEPPAAVVDAQSVKTSANVAGTSQGNPPSWQIITNRTPIDHSEALGEAGGTAGSCTPLPHLHRLALEEGEVAGPGCVRSGDPRGHQGLEGIGPQPIGTAGEVPLLEVCTCGMVHDL
ncbi:transposase [Streptomyces sp. NPDC021093]|uniref:transposase n=1 Tax=Streptomyces sp. NPDC021093 TaxID=3365112 RepID=UPI0037A40D6A